MMSFQNTSIVFFQDQGKMRYSLQLLFFSVLHQCRHRPLMRFSAKYLPYFQYLPKHTHYSFISQQEIGREEQLV